MENDGSKTAKTFGIVTLLLLIGTVVLIAKVTSDDKATLSGTKKKLKKSDVKKGDYIVLNTDKEKAKVKITSIHPEIEGKVIAKGKVHRGVLVLPSDFEKGYVTKTSKSAKIKQRIK